ncbi:hypothetical protein [Aquibacillus kalidii]|uniref:hypothetical protein n=1 Tax=Aquibacillus kalidii TaxID=2762597 RepID=UPI001644DE50|nr:hypothetical protein [Aquibacillus kalidii]
MFVLASIVGVRTGDFIFLIISLALLLAIPATIIVLVISFRKRNNRLKIVEEKLDKVLSETKGHRDRSSVPTGKRN